MSLLIILTACTTILFSDCVQPQGDEGDCALRRFLDSFVKLSFLPQFESRCFYRLSNVLGAPGKSLQKFGKLCGGILHATILSCRCCHLSKCLALQAPAIWIDSETAEWCDVSCHDVELIARVTYHRCVKDVDVSMMLMCQRY